MMTDIKNIEFLRLREGKYLGESMLVAGYYEPSDSGGGVFVWTNDLNTADDGGLVIIPKKTPRKGCWKRIYDSLINVRWFGAKGNGIDDDSNAFKRMFNIFNYAYFSYGTVYNGILKTDQVRCFYIPTGTYLLKQTIGWTEFPPNTPELRYDKKRLPNDIRIIGDARNASTLLFDVSIENTTNLMVGIQATDIPHNAGPFIHISHLTISNKSSANVKKVGLFANNGGYIFLSDCMFIGWDSGIWYNGTENVTIERTGFNSREHQGGTFIGIELGNPSMSPASTAVIAIRDNTFLSATQDHIGILAQSCNLLEVTGNFFATSYAIVLGSCANVNFTGNGTESGLGLVRFIGTVSTINFMQNEFNGGTYCMEVAETANVWQLSLLNNIFGAIEAAIFDLYDKVVSVHLGGNLLNTRSNGTPVPLFKRQSIHSTFAAFDIFHRENKDSLGLALRCNNGNESFPYYSISGFNKPNEHNNFTGSTISWVGNRGIRSGTDALITSGEIRYMQDFIVTSRENDKWTDTISHKVPLYTMLEFELKIIHTQSFSSARNVLVKGLLIKSDQVNPPYIIRMETIHDDMYDSDNNHSRQPILSEIMKVNLELEAITIAVKGFRESQWLLALTVFQIMQRNVATAE